MAMAFTAPVAAHPRCQLGATLPSAAQRFHEAGPEFSQRQSQDAASSRSVPLCVLPIALACVAGKAKQARFRHRLRATGVTLRKAVTATAELDNGVEEIKYVVGGDASTFGSVRKTLHIIRHGEANHNAAAAKFPKGDPRRKTEAYENLDFFDAPLNDVGLAQCKGLRDSEDGGATLSDVDLVLVSPLTRTLQTASEVFPEGDNSSRPRFVVVESLREYNSSTPHPCDWRRMRMDLEPDFPHMDWSVMSPSIDMILGPGTVERPDHCDARLEWLLVWLRRQPETNIALVTHNAVMRRFFKEHLRPAGYESELSDHLKNLELRSVPISFD
eukprot:TRINITY_DN34956_c0_g1_i3.p1 TRINITY_DN34956_c0_g1~~TRINITY_DN34956_c0_g1_i3.p1  ORF type:complete len:329 (-),score=41.40 TRINITY_DN34956_c0_g1_i3:250-1236(-)